MANRLPSTPISSSQLDTRPLYQRTEEALLGRLKGCHPGDRLPSEEQLSGLLGVSRTTIREVLRSLEEQGRVVRRHGVGTFVSGAQPLFEGGLEVLESLDALARRLGLDSGMQDLVIREEPADAHLAACLDLPAGAPVFVLSRARTAHGQVIAYMVDVVPAQLISLDRLRDQFTGSVLEFFSTTGIVRPAYAHTTLHAIQANRELSRHLKVTPRTALLLLEETLYSPENRPVNTSRNYYNTALFQFYILRKHTA